MITSLPAVAKVAITHLARVSICLALCLAWELKHTAQAQDFSAKQVRLFIGFAPGGGMDTNGRLIARHIGKHLPGNPTLIPQNKPGAGSMTAASGIYTLSPKDGSEIGLISSALPVTLATQQSSESPLDARRLTWVGSLTKEVIICIANGDAKVKAFDDLYTTEMVAGGIGPGSQVDLYLNVLNGFFGTKFKIVTGYRGSSEILLAMARSEVEGTCRGYSVGFRTSAAEALATGKIKILMQAGLTPNPEIKAPFILDLARTDEQRQVMKFAATNTAIGNPFIAPPDLPPAIAKTLRGALMATTKDAEYLAETKKLDIDLDPTPGEAVQKIVDDLYATPKPVLDKVKPLLGPG